MATASRQMLALRVVVRRFLPRQGGAVPGHKGRVHICPARNDRGAIATEKAGNPLPLHHVFFSRSFDGRPPIQFIISEGAVQVEVPQYRESD